MSADDILADLDDNDAFIGVFNAHKAGGLSPYAAVVLSAACYRVV
jgi:hypothetical protein